MDMLVTVNIVKHKAGAAKAGINGIMSRKLSQANGWRWIVKPKIIHCQALPYDRIQFEANKDEAKDYIINYLRASPYYYHGAL